MVLQAVARFARPAVFCRMSVDLTFAIRVQRMAVRERLTVAAIAGRLAASEVAVIDALTALAIPLPGVATERPARPSAQDRAAMFNRMPKRMQERMARIAKGESDLSSTPLLCPPHQQSDTEADHR